MAPPAKTVLIVDNNPINGQAMGVILEQIGAKYTCEAVTGRQQAIERVVKRTYDLIILETDIDGHLDGLKLAQLLLMRKGGRSKATSPVVILTSSKPDRETIQQGASLGVANFIVKPYFPHIFLERVERALLQKEEIEEGDFKKNLTKTLKEISQIPTLSAVFAKVQELLSAPEPSVNAVSSVIETDPAITMRVLRLANSAYFGFTKTVKTMKHAISLLGFQTIKNVVLAASTFEALGKGTDSGGLNKPGLWQHAIGCSGIATILTQKLNIPETDGFVGSLLHDVGKIIFDTFFFEFYTPVIEAVRARKIAIIDAEREVLGLTHAEVGMHLATMWNLPPDLINTISLHHDPMMADEAIRPTVALVHISDAICRKLGVGDPGDATVPPIDQEILDLLNIQPDLLERWMPEMKGQAEKSVSFLAAVTEA